MCNKSLLSALALLIALTVPAAAEVCWASHYGVGDGYGGRKTASGERMNPGAMTARTSNAAFRFGRSRHEYRDRKKRHGSDQ